MENSISVEFRIMNRFDSVIYLLKFLLVFMSCGVDIKLVNVFSGTWYPSRESRIEYDAKSNNWCFPFPRRSKRETDSLVNVPPSTLSSTTMSMGCVTFRSLVVIDQ